MDRLVVLNSDSFHFHPYRCSIRLSVGSSFALTSVNNRPANVPIRWQQNYFRSAGFDRHRLDWLQGSCNRKIVNRKKKN